MEERAKGCGVRVWTVGCTCGLTLASLCAQARRQRLKAIDRDDEPSEQDLIDRAAEEEILQKARLQMEEQEDEIKALNSLITSAKAHAIREAQLEEKAALSQVGSPRSRPRRGATLTRGPLGHRPNARNSFASTP